MKDFSLYVITDTKSSSGKSHLEIASEAIEGGADIIQLRDKNMTAKELINTGYQIKGIALKKRVTFIVNDRVDMVIATDADGVHLGQEDMPIEIARKILGKGKLIGISTHSVKQAVIAQDAGADYIAIGPIFATPTKPDYNAVGLGILDEIRNKIKIPYVAIGGINKGNVNEVIEHGVKRIAVVRAVTASPDIVAATKELKELLNCSSKRGKYARV